MDSQPVAVITDADVERIVRRDYAAEQVPEIVDALASYGVEEWEREAPRVRAAILKLANGDRARLLEELAVAKRDYRDVLAGAEYLTYGALTLRDPAASPEDVQRAITSDWAQFQDWLHR